MAARDVVRFGTFELDHSSGELRSQGRRVALQSQPAQVLSLLVRQPGLVVTREELRAAVWSDDRFVEFDAALNTAVNKIRQALRDSASAPRFIETVPKRGYRFLAEVRPVGPPPSFPATLRRRWPYLGAALLIAALTPLGAVHRARPPAPPSPRSVTVLRFKPPVGAARDEALALGLTEAGKPTTNAAAYERYLRGRHLVTRRTQSDLRRAAELLEEAITLDPDSAAAHASLADAYLGLPALGAPLEPFAPRARQAALRAVRLDHGNAEAHATLGTVLTQFDWDAEAGERELRRALELDPDNAAVLRLYSLFLWQDGRFQEALALNDRELALDPASTLANRNRAIILYYARRYDECVAQCLKALELDRYFHTVYGWMGRAHEQMGRHEAAVQAFIKPFTFTEENRAAVASLRDGFRGGGVKGFWRRWLQLDLQGPDRHDDERALAYLRLGDREQALRQLEGLLRERALWIRTLKVEPLWDPLRGDPRFQGLLRRAGLTRDAR